MVTTKTAQDKGREALYASLGAGQLVVEKAKDYGKWVRDYSTPAGFRAYWSKRRTAALKSYKQLAARGKKLARGVRSSAAAKRAEEQTQAARRQVKTAANSVRKAFGGGVEATRTAAKKVS